MEDPPEINLRQKGYHCCTCLYAVLTSKLDYNPGSPSKYLFSVSDSVRAPSLTTLLSPVFISVVPNQSQEKHHKLLQVQLERNICCLKDTSCRHVGFESESQDLCLILILCLDGTVMYRMELTVVNSQILQSKEIQKQTTTYTSNREFSDSQFTS